MLRELNERSAVSGQRSAIRGQRSALRLTIRRRRRLASGAALASRVPGFGGGVGPGDGAGVGRSSAGSGAASAAARFGTLAVPSADLKACYRIAVCAAGDPHVPIGSSHDRSR
jgi:hypothetical protein